MLVVVSAFARATNLLLSMAEERSIHYLEDFIKLHERWLDGLSIEEELRDLSRAMNRAYTFPCRAAYQDHVLSVGERVAAKIFASHLGNGVPVDAYHLLFTDGKFGDASVDLKRSAERMKIIRKIWESGKIPVVTGFLGNYLGYRTTLGRNGSDYTAGVLGHLLNADSIILMSDVEGVFTGDPKFIKDARVIPLLSYDRALLAAKLGMKRVHPKAIEASRRRIKILLGSTKDRRMGTTIGNVGMRVPIIVHRVHSPGYYRVSIIGHQERFREYKCIECKRDYQSYLVKDEELKDALRSMHEVVLHEIS